MWWSWQVKGGGKPEPQANPVIALMGGTVCGSLVRNEAGALAAVSVDGRITWLDDAVVGQSGKAEHERNQFGGCT